MFIWEDLLFINRLEVRVLRGSPLFNNFPFFSRARVYFSIDFCFRFHLLATSIISDILDNRHLANYDEYTNSNTLFYLEREIKIR